MKLLQELLLLELGSAYVIDREDLIFLQKALGRYENNETGACFIGALTQAIKIASDDRVQLSHKHLSRVLDDVAEKKGHRSNSKLHYNDVAKTLRKKPIRSNLVSKKHLVDLDLRELHTVDEIRANLKQGLPVIISVEINDLYWDWWSAISGWRNRNQIEVHMKKYNEISVDFKRKVKAGIIPYPSPNMIDDATENGRDTTHSIVCVGYDATEKAFICKDVLVKKLEVKLSGLFKIEERIFFDKVLRDKKISVVKHVMSLSIKDIKDEDDSKDLLSELRAKYETFQSYTHSFHNISNWVEAILPYWNNNHETMQKILRVTPELAKLLVSIVLLNPKNEATRYYSFDEVPNKNQVFKRFFTLTNDAKLAARMLKTTKNYVLGYVRGVDFLDLCRHVYTVDKKIWREFTDPIVVKLTSDLNQILSKDHDYPHK